MKYKFLVSCYLHKEVTVEAETQNDAWDKLYEELDDIDMTDGDESERQASLLECEEELS